MRKRTQAKKSIQPLKVRSLRLDDNNFRFPEGMRGTSQERLLLVLDRDYDLLPIGRSLAENGYFIEEPLIVIPEPPNFIVVEGNRRLAALMLLLDEDKRSLSKDSREWEALARDMKEDLSEVPAVVHDSREEIVPILGFRHIAGIQKWEPLAKARYINNLVEERGRRANFKEIADETGTYSEPTILKHYIAYRAYLQARDDFQIDTSGIEESYSLFYRACTAYPSMQHFIDLSKGRSRRELRRPVPSDKAEALEELIGYIYGTQEVKPVIRESREMGQLAEVIASRRAIKYLRKTRDLERAHDFVAGELPSLIDNLTEASYYLEKALIGIRRHKDERKVKEIVRRLSKIISQIFKHFPDLHKKPEVE